MTAIRYQCNLAILAALVTLAALLTGCGTTPAPASSATAPAPTATIPEPAASPTAPEPAPTSGNPFISLLGPVAAPPGWTVKPCEGQGPYLCVSAGDEFASSVELLQYPLDQHQAAQEWMAEAGLESGLLLDPDDPVQSGRAREVLHSLQAHHMGVVEDDRAVTYPEGRAFVLLEPEEARVGRLPGLFYGFAGVEKDGQTYERWLTYAALDGQYFYFLTAFYDPGDTPGSLPSDEALLTFAPYLRDIVAGLRLPGE
jgi:hypothetical protein